MLTAEHNIKKFKGNVTRMLGSNRNVSCNIAFTSIHNCLCLCYANQVLTQKIIQQSNLDVGQNNSTESFVYFPHVNIFFLQPSLL